MKKHKKLFHILALTISIVVFGILMRITPHPWNMTPLVAIGLFSFHYIDKKFAWAVPLAVLLVSDLFLGFYNIKLLLVVYGSFMIITLFGFLIKKGKFSKKIPSLFMSATTSSIFFFLVTNFAVWKFSQYYPSNFSGLMSSYTLGLPFLKNMIIGDIVYTFGLFGVYELVKNYVARLYAKRQLLDYKYNFK